MLNEEHGPAQPKVVNKPTTQPDEKPVPSSGTEAKSDTTNTDAGSDTTGTDEKTDS